MNKKSLPLLAGLLLGCAMPHAALAIPAHPNDPPAAIDGAEHDPSGKFTAEPAPAPEAEKTNAPASFGRYLSGRVAEAQGDTDKGVQFLKESLRHDPSNRETLAGLYRMLVLSGKLEEALPYARKLTGTRVVDEGREFSPEMLLAMEAAKKGDFDGAQKHLATIQRTGFNNLLVPLLEAWLKHGQGKSDAKPVEEGAKPPEPVKAEEIMPNMAVVLPHVYLNAAFINELAGFDEAARKQYEAAVSDERIQPFRAVEALVNYYDRHNMGEERGKLVENYFTTHGGSFLADTLLAKPAEKDKMLVADMTQGLAEVFYTIANIFHGARSPADEIATLHFALYLRPDFPAAQFLKASAYELAGDYQSAINTYKTINPESPYYVRGRVRALYDAGELGDKAGGDPIAELNKIAAEMPGDLDALLAKGDILRARKRYGEAVQAYNEAADRVAKPQARHWIVFFSRGVCYERLGQWKKAETDMQKALELSPDEPDVLNYLGYSWLTMSRNIPEARRMIEKAYEQRPEDAHIIDSMGYALYMTGEYASAQEYFEQALERTPNDTTVNEHLGDTYWQLGRQNEARYQWQRALTHATDEDARRTLAQKLESGIKTLQPKQASAAPEKPAEPPAPVPVELAPDE